jgi:hypothetical protein
MTRIVAGSPFSILRNEPRWVAWREQLNKRTGKTTKVAYTPGTSRFASSTSPNTWGTYDAALAMKGCEGVGYVLTDHENIAGMDFDWAFDPASGLLRPWAAEPVSSVDSYVEFSPTAGKGLHLFGLVDDDVPTVGRVIPMGPDGQHIELYVRGGGGRYLTVTGQPFGPERPLNDISALVRRLLEVCGNPTPNNGGTPPPVDPDAGLAWLPREVVDLIVHGAPAGADRSKELCGVVSELREIGWSSERIVALLRAHPEGIAARCLERGRDDIDRQVRLCLRRIDDHIASRRCASTQSASAQPEPNASQGAPSGSGAWAGEGVGASWDDPDFSLLDDRRSDDLPEFPLGVFNTDWQAWVGEAAHGAGVTVGFVALPLLGVAGGLVGAARRVRPVPAWSEPLALWACVVGQSGSGKTPGLDTLRRPLAALDRERQGHVDALRRAHETRAAAAKGERKLWEAAVADAIVNGNPPPVLPAAAVDPGQFVAPRLYVSDATIERLAVLLTAQPRGITLIADELAGWLGNLGRYNSGSDRDFFLESWNGRSYVVERMGRPPVVLDHLMVAVSGGIQPDKLANALAGDDDGLHARLVYAWPAEPPYRPLNDVASEASPFILNALRRLITLPSGSPGQPLEPQSLVLTEDALSAFEAFRRTHFDGRHALAQRELEWWAKGPSQVLRLAGVLTLLDWAGGVSGNTLAVDPEPSEINAQFIASAVEVWTSYLWPHAQATIRLIGLDSTHVEERQALRWLKATRPAEVSREDIRVRTLNRRLDAAATQTLIDGLVDAGWLRETTTLSGLAGRPARRWEINPCLYLP